MAGIVNDIFVGGGVLTTGDIKSSAGNLLGLDAILANAITYAPVCGGTSSTTVLQYASTGQSNSGYVLTSTGASSLPTWQAAAGGGITTINGDQSTTITPGSTVTFSAEGSTSGGTATFNASGTTVQLKLIDARSNVCLGTAFAHNSNPSADYSTSVGWHAGGDYSTGYGGQYNAAFGYSSLPIVTGGNYNIALGTYALANLSSGADNIAIGYYAGGTLTTETGNISIGSTVYPGAGENNTLRIGSATGTAQGNLQAAYICGINGTTVGSPTAVFIDTTTDQLTTSLSSRRFKENIVDMGDYSSLIYNLRPVTFNYIDKPTKHQLPGLIAEEVDETMPSLALYDKEGKPLTVRYHDLPALLLNEIQKLRKELDELKGAK